VHQVGN